MHYEWFAIICIIFCFLILGLEYLWLTIFAKKQDDDKNKYETVSFKVTNMIEGILYSPTESSRKNETEALKDLMGDDTKIFEMISAQLEFWDEYGDEETFENKSEVIDSIYEAVDPINLFAGILKSEDKYKVGYACRRLADFDAYDYLNDIIEFSKSKNRDIAYNAAMALSRLGYTEGVAEYILSIENDRKYSARIINELFDGFSADRAELAGAVLKDCGEYMQTVVIKAISHYRLHQFEDVFIKGTVSKNKNMRIACVKAIGDLENPANEHILMVAAKDREWVVRLSAIKGLEKIATPNAINTIKESLKDKEWWIRSAAANALVDMNVSIAEIEEVLDGYDKYASDAIKYALYRTVNLKE
ncbi:MAG: HEAT repeat domain-containing protein [Eubacterium sp.]|nr:HEAT repeat domain-containing protein [Eubacterium sp.]